LAALVNGQPILLADYERELARFELAQEALGLDSNAQGEAYNTQVLNALIERELIQQAAAVERIVVAPETVQARMNELRQVNNERGSFDDWLAANLYSEEEFEQALTAELVAGQMVSLITADVPEAVEHVHVRYIQVDDEGTAQLIKGELAEGSEFADLASRYSLDQLTAPYGGDLGWFARGSLLVPEIEEVAFALEDEEVSDIIAVTDAESGLTTYYIVQLIERDPNRMLSADLRHRLLETAFKGWMQEQIDQATILIFLEG
jgi:parvulin-like peptidyl-prolyl isomerase